MRSDRRNSREHEREQGDRSGKNACFHMTTPSRCDPAILPKLDSAGCRDFSSRRSRAALFARGWRCAIGISASKWAGAGTHGVRFVGRAWMDRCTRGPLPPYARHLVAKLPCRSAASTFPRLRDGAGDSGWTGPKSESRRRSARSPRDHSRPRVSLHP